MDPAKNWKDKISWITPKPIVHRVQGEEVNFYPVCVATLFKLREIAAPIASACAVLFSDKDRDAGTLQRNVPLDGQMSTETVLDPLKPEMAKFRADQMQQAVSTLIETVTSDKNSSLLAEIIMGSARDLFPDKKDWPPATELFQTIHGPALTDFIIGVAKANKDVLGPLVSHLSGLGGEITKRLSDRVGPVAVDLKLA